MVNALDILSKYREKKVKISLDNKGENLTLKGALDKLTNEDKKELKANKNELVAFFKLQNQSKSLIEKTNLNVGELIPLTPGQNGIWAQCKLENATAIYNIPELYQFEIVSFDMTRFQEALQDLCANNKVLSYVFSEQEGVPYQYVTEVDINTHLFFENIAELNSIDQKTVIQKNLTLGANTEFDLEKQPPWKIQLFQIGNNEYVFILIVHHLIADGASLSLLINALMECYNNMPNSYVATQVQYHDYAKWLSNKENFSDSANYWKSTLKNYSEELSLFLCTQSEPDAEEGTFEYNIEGNLKDDIIRFCQKNALSNSQFYTFVFTFLLSKYARVNDVIIGTPSEGRNHPELGNIIGNLVNVLPIRVHFNYRATVLEELNKVKENFVQLLEHQTYPFEYILKDIEYKKKWNKFPLFNTVISFPNNLKFKSESEFTDGKKAFALYSLSCVVTEDDKRHLLYFEYDKSIYNKGFIQRLSKQMIGVAQQIIKMSNALLEDIKLINAYEGCQLEKSSLLKGQDTILDQIKKCVEKNGEAIAINNENNTVSYRKLWGRSKKVAAWLKHNGTYEGDYVIVQLPASTDLIAAMIGVWMVGGVYVPVAPDVPDNRLKEIIIDCNSQCVLNKNVFAALPGEIDFAVELSAESPAYILYTSGSTGKPKGVIVSHKALLAKLREETELIGFGDQMNTLTLTSPSFDVSFLELILPLLSGGKITIANDAKDLNQTYADIQKQKVNLLQGTPTYFSSFINQLNSAEAELLNTTLNLICIGGESLNGELVRALKNKLPNVQINNHYGPTEITIDAIVKQDVVRFAENNIGKPIGKTQAHIVDPCGNPLPEYTVGELLIGGPCLAEGYHGRQKLTDSKFFFSEKLQTKVYATGDLAAWTDEGEIQFIGRVDDQVKHRGYRIELAEINTRLKQDVGVDEAYTYSRNNMLISWVVAADFDKGKLKYNLEKVLPAYMIPDDFLLIDQIPVTANGKVDINQLPLPEYINKGFVAPRNELEAKLVAIWKDTLKVNKVGVYDHFYELGGDSLSVIKLLFKYQEEFSVNIDINTFLKLQNIAENADLIRTKSREAISRINPVRLMESYPLSVAQKRLWLAFKSAAASVAYNMPEQMYLPIDTDINALREAIQNTIKRHESLRTVFKLNGSGEIRQWINHTFDVNDYFSVVSCKKENEGADFVQDYIAKHNRHHFDLEKGPLLKLTLILLANDKCLLVYNIHHIISDGWSMEVLQNDIQAFYEASLRNVNEPTKLKVQYKDYAVWQKENLTIPEIEKGKEFWKEELTGDLPIFNLHASSIRPKNKTFEGNILEVDFSKEKALKLRAFCLNNEISLFDGILGMWKILAYRYTNDKRIITGIPVSGRIHADLQDQIGFYVNTIPVITSIEPSLTVQDFLEAFKHKLDACKVHQNYPFDAMVAELNGETDLSRNPIFDVLFNYQKISAEIEHEELINGDIRCFEEAMAKFDLEFTLNDYSGNLGLVLVYNKAIYEDDFIHGMFTHFLSLIDSVLEDPTQKVDQIQFLSEKEKQQLLVGFNATNTTYPADKTIVDLFEQQAIDTPDNNAVVYPPLTLSYRELNRYANQFAHFLIEEQGVTEGELISVKLNPSHKNIISILAILKLGSAYVPIDPAYPEERIAHIVKNSNSRLVINDQLWNEFELSREKYQDENLNRSIVVDDLAYLIYTSGTTGVPKGVMVEHKAVVRLVKPGQFFPLSQNNILLATGSVAFDATIIEYFGTLLNGSTLVLQDKINLLDNSKLEHIINQYSVDSLWITASWFKSIVDNQINVFKSVKQLIVGGDIVSPTHVKKVYAINSSIKIVNGYGPTENTTFSATYDIKRPSNYLNIPIGKPIENSTAYILNSSLNLCPIGVEGELCLGGKGIARGYFNAPELTAIKFIKNPHKSDEIIYKTGDLAYWLPDGNIVFVGRKDDQTKIRGNRIELMEVEAQVRKFGTAFQQVFITIKQVAEEKELVVYYVASSEVDLIKLREDLRIVLPGYMVPNYFKKLDTIPLTPHGKTDKKQLPKITKADLVRTTFVAPRTDEERNMGQIWGKALKINSVGIKDNLFEIGGNSLKIAEIISQMKKELNLAYSISEVYENPTIEGLVKLEKNQPISIVPINNKGPFPLSQSQMRLWASHQMNPKGNLMQMETEVPENFSLERFKLAVATLIKRHEALRTSFVDDDNYMVAQQVHEVDDYGLFVGVKSNLDGSEEKEVLDIESLPLIKFYCVGNGKERKIQLFVNHIVFDGLSGAILLKEYHQLYENPELELEKTSLQYKDYAKWEHDQIVSKAFKKERSYWLEKFEDEVDYFEYAKRGERNLRFLDRANQNYRQSISGEAFVNIQAYCRQHNLTEYTFFHALLKISVYLLNKQEDIIIGSHTELRGVIGLDQVIGVFLNLLPIRFKIAPKETLLDNLKKSQSEIALAQDNKNLPFNIIAKEISRTKFKLNEFPIVDVFLTYNNIDFETGAFNFENKANGAEINENASLNLGVIKEEQSYTLLWEYNDALYTPAFIEKWHTLFERGVNTILENDNIKLETLIH